MSEALNDATQVALHLRDTGLMESLGQVFGRGVATAFFEQLEALDKAKEDKLRLAAPLLADAAEMALRDWFELHYGANDIGMAALIREKLKAALKAAGRLP